MASSTNAADGTVAFDTIAYTEADAGKTYTYTISEVEGIHGGITYDKDIRTVTVTVTDKGDGTLDVSAAIRLGDVIVDALAFINTYIADGFVSFEVNKVLTGRALQADQFAFELKDASGNVLQTKKNAADGTVSFDAIRYALDDVGKTFTYTVTEKNEGAEGYTYDSHSVGVSVTVSDNGDGTLKVDVLYDGDRVFTNSYKASAEPTPTPTEPTPTSTPTVDFEPDSIEDEPTPGEPSPTLDPNPTPTFDSEPTPDGPTPDEPTPGEPTPTFDGPTPTVDSDPTPDEPTPTSDGPTPTLDPEPNSTPEESTLPPTPPVSQILVTTGVSTGIGLLASVLVAVAGVMFLRRRRDEAL